MPSFSWNEAKAHCCGVMEMGAFTRSNMIGSYGGWITVRTEQEKDLWPAVFAKMMQKTAARRNSGRRLGAFAHIWFKKPPRSRQYEFHELMKQFKNSPQVWNLGSFVNPNTGNRIQGYGFKTHGR